MMKKLILLSTFFISISVYALPNCPSDTSVRWHNCFGTYAFDGDQYVGEWKDNLFHGQGTYTYASGDKYVGEFKDGLRNGRGTYTFADGEKLNGYFMNGDYIPRICEDMGFVKGTESFGDCILKLIEDL